MLNYTEDLKNFIKILYTLDMIKSYNLLPNGLELSIGDDDLRIIFGKNNEIGKGISSIRKTHHENVKFNEEEIFSLISKIEEN